MKDSRLNTLGMFVEPEEKKVTMLYVNDEVLNFIISKTNKENKGYRVFFKDNSTGKIFDMHVYIESREIRAIQDLYISLLSK